jgi:hypothetical protein
MFVSLGTLESENIWYNIYVFVLSFGLCMMFFELFSMIKIKTLNKILSFPIALIIRFFIPMTAILLILLGSIQGMYPSDSTFLSDTAKIFGSDKYISIIDGGSIGSIMGFVCYKTVSEIYLLGVSRPKFMLTLCILATFILLYITIYRHFVKGDSSIAFISDEYLDNDKKNKKQSTSPSSFADYVKDI